MKKQPTSFTRSLIDCLHGQSFLTSFFLVTLLGSILPQVVHAQAPPCPSSSSINFTFEPTTEGDSHTATINLAPCELIEVHESHDMGGDPNRGTLFRVSFLNSAQEEIVGQNIYGFLTASDNKFPWLYEEPFPFTGVRRSERSPGDDQGTGHLGCGLRQHAESAAIPIHSYQVSSSGIQHWRL